jgi:hypothetical protein
MARTVLKPPSSLSVAQPLSNNAPSALPNNRVGRDHGNPLEVSIHRRRIAAVAMIVVQKKRITPVQDANSTVAHCTKSSSLK